MKSAHSFMSSKVDSDWSTSLTYFFHFGSDASKLIAASADREKSRRMCELSVNLQSTLSHGVEGLEEDVLPVWVELRWQREIHAPLSLPLTEGPDVPDMDLCWRPGSVLSHPSTPDMSPLDCPPSPLEGGTEGLERPVFRSRLGVSVSDWVASGLGFEFVVEVDAAVGADISPGLTGLLRLMRVEMSGKEVVAGEMHAARSETQLLSMQSSVLNSG